MTTANGNFLDICVLEWCKLFGDSRGKHYWFKIVKDQIGFYNGLLKKCGVSDEIFKSSIKEMRTYRDTFVAHLDLKEKMHIPQLGLVQASVAYLYEYLLNHEDDGGFFTDAPYNVDAFYAEKSRGGLNGYRR